MKKYFILFAMFLGISFNGFANAKEIDYNFNFNSENIKMYLNLDSIQNEEVKTIHYNFNKSMQRVPEIKDEKTKNQYIQNCIDCILTNMVLLLDEKQYRKYLRLLNTTFHNKGIII